MYMHKVNFDLVCKMFHFYSRRPHIHIECITFFSMSPANSDCREARIPLTATSFANTIFWAELHLNMLAIKSQSISTTFSLSSWLGTSVSHNDGACIRESWFKLTSFPDFFPWWNQKLGRSLKVKPAQQSVVTDVESSSLSKVRSAAAIVVGTKPSAWWGSYIDSTKSQTCPSSWVARCFFLW